MDGSDTPRSSAVGCLRCAPRPTADPAPSDPLGLRRLDATPAAARVANAIRRGGPITFHQFMEIALFDPEVGYYAHTGSGPGLQADYVTSPELHGAFGALATAQIEELWRFLGRPGPFWLIEGGPGTGRFATDVLMIAEAAYPELAASLRVALIERNPRLRHVQAVQLAPWRNRMRWLNADPAGWPCLGTGCVFANELLDAFPVHRLVGTAAGIHERYVTIGHGRLVEIDGPVSSPLLARQIASGGGELRPGSLGEVSLEAPRWVASTAGLLDRGYVLVVDYGEPAHRLYGPDHPAGTLRAYRQHVRSNDLLALPGRQDLTAHVDVTAITRAANSAGLALLGSTRQLEFLDRLGLLEIVGRVADRFERRDVQYAHHRALDTLWSAEDLGQLAVLLFGKSASADLPRGFGGEGAVSPPDVPAAWRIAED